MAAPLPLEPDGPGLWLLRWHRSGDTRYGNRGDILVRFERSIDAEPHYREWRQDALRYEATWYGRVAEVLADGGVRNDAGDVFGPELFEWHRGVHTSRAPGNAPPASGPF